MAMQSQSPGTNWAAIQLSIAEGDCERKMPQEQAWPETTVIEAWQSINTEKTASGDIYGFQTLPVIDCNGSTTKNYIVFIKLC